MVMWFRLLKLSSFLDGALRRSDLIERVRNTAPLISELRKREDLNEEQVRVLAFREHKSELGSTVSNEYIRLIVEIAFYYTREKD